MEYDAANRLVTVKADDNQTALASYTYGATNERLLSDELGTRTYYAAEGGQVLAEYVEYGGATVPQWAKSYVYLGGRLLTTFAPVTGGEFVEHHHPDRLGTRLVTRPADGTSFEQAHLPFGTALSAESTGGTNRRFTSYDRSGATGLDYAVNRRYDPMQGRFTQVDPIGVAAASIDDPQTLNLYSYCGNDPVNHTDPDGLFFKKLFNFFKKAAKWIAVAVAVAVAVVAVIAFTGGAAAGVVIKLALQSAQLFAQAFGKETLARIFGGAASGFGSTPGYGGVGAGGTPVFNPNAGMGTGSGSVSLFINRYAQDDCGSDANPCDWGDRIEINASTTRPWYRRLGGWIWDNKGEIALEVGLTFIPPARIAGLLFRAGRWGYRGYKSWRAARAARKSLGANPFKGKTVQQIDRMFMDRGFSPRGADPMNGLGGYVNPRSNRSFHIDPANRFGEPPHVDINRLRTYRGPLEKRKYPM